MQVVKKQLVKWITSLKCFTVVSEAGNTADIPALCSMAHAPHGLALYSQKHLAKEGTQY